MTILTGVVPEGALLAVELGAGLSELRQELVPQVGLWLAGLRPGISCRCSFVADALPVAKG